MGKNMKLTFQMTADEFYIGWKQKIKKNNFKDKTPLLLFILFIVTALLMILTKNAFYITYLILFIALIVFTKFMNKKAITKQFYASPTVSGEATLCTYTEGLEIINSYQKIFVPWQSIFSVKETEKYLIIMPTFRTSVFVISKERYNGSELSEIIALLKQNTTVEEGKR